MAQPGHSSKTFGEPIVELDSITKAYKLEGGEEVTALRDLSLTGEIAPIRRGEFVMIRGPSGGGKTSLLNIIGTIDKPTKGRMTLFGTEIDFTKATDAYLADLRLRKIGFVFQSFNLLSTLSATENVELPMAMLDRLPASERAKTAAKLLQLVGLEDRAAHLPSELSGGEQQRVTIARALSNTPELLLLDEPTGDLDTKNTVLVMDLLLRINQEAGMTFVMVTHNPDLECYADRVLYVADGRIVGQALNTVQSRLEYDTYVQYLHREAEA